VVEDAAGAALLAANDETVDRLTYFWTLAGNNRLYNCIELAGSTGSPHQNYGLLMGVPGSAEAKFHARAIPSTATLNDRVILSNWRMPFYSNPMNFRV